MIRFSINKFLSVSIILSCVLFAGSSMAQGLENNLRKEILARKIIDKSLQDENIMKMIEGLSHNFINSIKSNYSACLNEGEFERFRREFATDSQSALKDIVLENKDSITSIYINLFTEDELEEVISFMDSEIYKKINIATPMFQQMIMAHIQTAVENNQVKIKQAIEGELKKQGRVSCESINIPEAVGGGMGGGIINNDYEQEL